MTEASRRAQAIENLSDRSDKSDSIDIARLFQSDVITGASDKSDQGKPTPGRRSDLSDSALAMSDQVSRLKSARSDRPDRSDKQSEGRPATEAGRQRAASLPNAPPTCSACGATDWTVAITEPDGRKLHVECWKAEQEAKLEGHKARAEALSDADGVARTPEAIAAVWDAAEAQAPLIRMERRKP